MLKNGTLASPAIALANNVLPVPGGQPSKRPSEFSPKRSNFWVAQKFDDFLHVLLGLFNARDIVKRHAGCVLVQ